MMYEFKAMRTATKNFPPGSPDWCEGMSLRFQYTYEHLNHMGVDPIIEVLNELIPHEPWNKFPIEKPLKRADAYCELVIGVPWEMIEPYVRGKDAQLADKLLSLCNPGVTGRPLIESNDNIMTSDNATQGTSKSYTLNRLMRDAPEAYQRVLGGELSANAAAIEAGFRSVTYQISEKTTPEAAAQKIRERFGDDFAEELSNAINMEGMT